MPQPQAEQIRDRLHAAIAASGNSRLSRLARHPLKLAEYKLRLATGRRKDVRCPTIWAGWFDGVLPEHVTSVIWRTGYFDRKTSLTLLRYLEPGRSFVDIGAHFGYFSLLGSALVGPEGRVLSVEAMPETQAMLARNIAGNAPHDNITLHRGAALDCAKTLNFVDNGLIHSSLNSAFASRGRTGQTARQIEVAAEPVDALLDRYGLRDVAVVKVDAESSETLVMQGLSGLLARDAPVLVTEVGDTDTDRQSTAAQIELMAGHGYRPYRWTSADRLEPAPQTGPFAYDNFVFLPERLQAGAAG